MLVCSCAYFEMFRCETPSNSMVDCLKSFYLVTQQFCYHTLAKHCCNLVSDQLGIVMPHFVCTNHTMSMFIENKLMLHLWVMNWLSLTVCKSFIFMQL